MKPRWDEHGGFCIIKRWLVKMNGFRFAEHRFRPLVFHNSPNVPRQPLLSDFCIEPRHSNHRGQRVARYNGGCSKRLAFIPGPSKLLAHKPPFNDQIWGLMWQEVTGSDW